MTERFDPETLVAYVDGELDAARVQEIEAALRDDHALQDTVRRLREGAALMRGSFGDVMNEPLPGRVHAAISEAFSREARDSASKASRRRGGAWWPSLAAASLAALVVGLSGGYWFADERMRSELALRDRQLQEDQRALENAISAALEKRLSGDTVHWQNPDSGSRASITPVRTFKTSDGRWCREYIHDSQIDERTVERRAIACRVDDGVWRTRLVALDSS